MRTARRRKARTPPWICSPSWLKPSAATSSSGRSWPARTELWPSEVWFCLFSLRLTAVEEFRWTTLLCSSISTFFFFFFFFLEPEQYEWNKQRLTESFSVLNRTADRFTQSARSFTLHLISSFLFPFFKFQICHGASFSLIFEVKPLLDTEQDFCLLDLLWKYNEFLLTFPGSFHSVHLLCVHAGLIYIITPLPFNNVTLGAIMWEPITNLDQSHFDVFHPRRTRLLIVCKTNWINRQVSLDQMQYFGFIWLASVWAEVATRLS